MKEVLYQVMSDTEFNNLIKRVYNQNYEFGADEECSNDTEHAFDRINGNNESYDQRDLEEFKYTGKYSMIARALLNDMVKNGIIPSGNYLITVCW